MQVVIIINNVEHQGEGPLTTPNAACIPNDIDANTNRRTCASLAPCSYLECNGSALAVLQDRRRVRGGGVQQKIGNRRLSDKRRVAGMVQFVVSALSGISPPSMMLCYRRRRS